MANSHSQSGVGRSETQEMQKAAQKVLANVGKEVQSPASGGTEASPVESDGGPPEPIGVEPMGLTESAARQEQSTEAALVAQIQGELQSMQAAFAKGLEHARRAGELLVEAKKQFGQHGRWEQWIENNLDIASRTAQICMQICKNWDLVQEKLAANPSHMTDFTVNGARRLIAEAKGTAKKSSSSSKPDGDQPHSKPSGEADGNDVQDASEPEATPLPEPVRLYHISEDDDTFALTAYDADQEAGDAYICGDARFGKEDSNTHRDAESALAERQRWLSDQIAQLEAVLAQATVEVDVIRPDGETTEELPVPERLRQRLVK